MASPVINTGQRISITLSTLVALFSILYFVSISEYGTFPVVANALIFDLIISVPFIYWLLIRNTSIPNTTVVMVAVIGFFIGSRFIPSQNQFFLELAGKFALPILELSLITYLVINISKIRKIFKLNRLSMDRASTVRTAIQSVYQGRIASFMSDEILFFYYAFFNWGKYTLKENEFSYHKKSGITAIYGGLIFLVIVETFVLHLVISPYIPFLAWTITLLSIYSAFILFGLVRSLSHLPIKVEQNSLKLQYGLINRVAINFDTIKEISITKSSEDVKRISLLGALEEPNVLIHLKELATMTSIYGFKSKFQKLGIILDEPIKFVELMRSKTIHQN